MRVSFLHPTQARTAILLLLLSPFAVWPQGHSISNDGNQIVINRASHWRAWAGTGGTVEISTDGSIGPKFIRKNLNIALEAPDFATGDNVGGMVAGSNVRDARFLIDGDMSTTWGPDLDAPRTDWWVELNLGHVVVVEKIVLRFAEEGDGDPFNQFRVLLWHTPPPDSSPAFYLSGTSTPNYWEIGRTDRPNKTQRVFEYFPAPLSQFGGVGHRTIRTDGAFSGDPLEMIRIVVTNSDLDRGEEVTLEEYDAMSTDQQGALEYFRREPSGRQTPILQTEWENITPERQGDIHYFRREVPRLAEIEVWSLGDNLIFDVANRGGLATVETDASPVPKNMGNTISDGIYNSGHSGTIFGGLVYHAFIDLGAHFWIDTVKFLNDGVGGLDELALQVSDGSLAPDGSFDWTQVAGNNVAGQLKNIPELDNQNKYFQFEMEPTVARYIRAPFGNFGRFQNRKLWYAILEVLVYGEGHVAGVDLTSDLILLDSSKNLLSINWEATTPGGTSVQLQSRSGNTLEERFLYFDSDGNPIEPIDDPVKAKRNYDRKPDQKKGEIKALFGAGGDWSPWSKPYVASGAAITSPSPRQYLQIRATLLSDDPSAAASLHSIDMTLSDPVADRLVGEVWPTQIEALGRPQQLSYFLRPTFKRGQGFDEVRIDASSGAALELIETRIGSDADFSVNEPTVFGTAELEVVDSPDSTLWFRLPQQLDNDVDLVEVRFLTTTFSTSTSFRASSQDSDTPGWQRVDPGDATDLVNSQTTAVLALDGNRVILGLTVESPVMTPNGDGRNDETIFNFNIARISSEQTITVAIYDLSGSMVGQVTEERKDPRGGYSMPWKGQDTKGDLVPPGIYIARIEVDSQSASAASTSVQRLVHVAY